MFPTWLTDLEITFAPVPTALENVTARGVLWQAAPPRFLLHVPNVARYLVEDGQRLLIDAAPAAEEETVARFARTTPLAALAYQRGWLALHAAAFQMAGDELNHHNGLTFLIAGDSNAGKSTLLAAMIERGARMVADDLSIVRLNAEGQPVVYPAHPEVLLWDHSVNHLNPANLQKHPAAFRMDNGKNIFTAPAWVDAPAPACAIHCIKPRNHAKAERIPVRGHGYIQEISNILYNSHIADALMDRAAYFRIASALAQTVPLYRLIRPRGAWNVPELTDLLLPAS